MLLLLSGLPRIAAFLDQPVFAQTSVDLPQATIHVESQLVVLDIVVTDEKGNIVTDLSQNDFSVYEDGVPQKIGNFDRPFQENGAKTSLPADAPRDRNGNDDWADAPLTILVIDALNTPFEETGYSRYEVDRYLKAQPVLLRQPTIALWLSDSGFHAITSFTRHRDTLLSAIDAHKASIPDKMNRGDMVDQLSASLSALQQIALFSRGQRGNKQIIWIGRSFPGVDAIRLSRGQQNILKNAVSSTIDLLMKSRACVSVIDPTVIAPQPRTLVSDVPGPATISTSSSADPFAKAFSFMSFVEQTGGKYFYGHNDLDNEIERSIERGTSFYTLSYVPSEPVRGDKYRKIDIRLTDPKLRVQAKAGYYPQPADQGTARARVLQFDLREALVTGMAYTGVGLTIEGCKVDQGRVTATCNVLVDNNSLSFTTDGKDSLKRTLIVAAIGALDAHSKLLANDISRLGIGISPDHAGQSDLGRTKLTLHITVPPKATALRVVIRDSSGRIGTANLVLREFQELITATSSKGRN